MKKNDLKKVIKPLIRECLTEIFMEMNLEHIVEGVMKKTEFAPKTSEPKVVTESREVPPRQPQQLDESPEERRQRVMSKFGVSDIDWAEGTEPLDDSDEGNPELVSEEILRQTGLYKDYSKFVEK